ncbi:hypothetical protein FHR85_001133 [Alkalibacillus almallahensis]|nr:hypothetical protein [Alkalibacillus almallahensis]
MIKILNILVFSLISIAILHAIGGSYLHSEGYISNHYMDSYYSLVTYSLSIAGLLLFTYISFRERKEQKSRTRCNRFEEDSY